ncbi:MAG: hypothetical protein WBC04_11095 [Candidatus Acidiferrales bacterium]
MFYTGVMHFYRFTLSGERGTRNALNGPFLRDYFDSVLATRGWDDGDTFITSYIAHPMEGAIFGYIQQHNDPRYRTVEWGSGRDYWISRLRALAFSAALSTQWTLGPFSENSLGNVNLHDSPGFVDLVATPALGIPWMMGEDILDRYVVFPVEKRTANRAVLLLVRLLNPSRSWANLMAFKEPWYRETRPGFFRENYVQRKKLLKESKDGISGSPFDDYDRGSQTPSELPSPYPLEAPIELMTSTHYESFLGGGSCIGGGGSGAARVSPAFQVVAEVSGCLVINMPKGQSGDSLMYVVGPRWTPRAAHRISPYGQVLLGGRRITHETEDLAKRSQLFKVWNDGTYPHYPFRSDYSTERQANAFALAAGGGFDLRVYPALAWRVANLEYTHTWVPQVDQIGASQGIRVTTGLVLRIGTW